MALTRKEIFLPTTSLRVSTATVPHVLAEIQCKYATYATIKKII